MYGGEVRQWVKIGIESGIDQKPGESMLDEATVKDWVHRFFGAPVNELTLPVDQKWNVLLLKTGALHKS